MIASTLVLLTFTLSDAAGAAGAEPPLSPRSHDTARADAVRAYEGLMEQLYEREQLMMNTFNQNTQADTRTANGERARITERAADKAAQAAREIAAEQALRNEAHARFAAQAHHALPSSDLAVLPGAAPAVIGGGLAALLAERNAADARAEAERVANEAARGTRMLNAFNGTVQELTNAQRAEYLRNLEDLEQQRQTATATHDAALARFGVRHQRWVDARARADRDADAATTLANRTARRTAQSAAAALARAAAAAP